MFRYPCIAGLSTTNTWTLTRHQSALAQKGAPQGDPSTGSDDRTKIQQRNSPPHQLEPIGGLVVPGTKQPRCSWWCWDRTGRRRVRCHFHTTLWLFIALSLAAGGVGCSCTLPLHCASSLFTEWRCGAELPEAAGVPLSWPLVMVARRRQDERQSNVVLSLEDGKKLLSTS